MGFIGKVTRAVTLWTNTDFRRAEVLAETIFYGTGMAMIGRALFWALPWTAAAHCLAASHEHSRQLKCPSPTQHTVSVGNKSCFLHHCRLSSPLLPPPPLHVWQCRGCLHNPCSNRNVPSIHRRHESTEHIRFDHRQVHPIRAVRRWCILGGKECPKQLEKWPPHNSSKGHSGVVSCGSVGFCCYDGCVDGYKLTRFPFHTCVGLHHPSCGRCSRRHTAAGASTRSTAVASRLEQQAWFSRGSLS